MTRAQGLFAVALCGLALAWFSSTGRMAHPHAASGGPAPSRAAAPRDIDVAGQSLRLRSHLAAVRPLRPSQRNLFEFRAAGSGAAAAADHRLGGAPLEPPAEAEERPEMQLLGIAEDPAPEGTVRTAVLSALSQLFVVRAGERVLGRYEIVRIAADAVELKDGEKTFTLKLK